MSVKICSVCECENANYKCPKCKKFYCSVACCSRHKESCNSINESKNSELKEISTETSSNKYNFPTEDTVPIEKLEQLRHSEEVKNCLRNPQVKDIISFVLKDNNPTKAIAIAMKEPIFVELADACLKIVEPSDEEKPC